MKVLHWSKRAVIACLTLWALLVAVYITLGAVRHETLPDPYDLMVMLTLTTATVYSGVVWVAGWLRSHLDTRLDRIAAEVLDRIDEMEQRADARDGRIYYSIAMTGKELARLRTAVEEFSTVDLGIRYPVAVGGYDDGYADGLARKPMANVVPIDRRPADGS